MITLDYVLAITIGLQTKFQRKNVNIFLSVLTLFGCSKVPSHWDGSFEYPQPYVLADKKKC